MKNFQYYIANGKVYTTYKFFQNRLFGKTCLSCITD
jgi:hypothetical protein